MTFCLADSFPAELRDERIARLVAAALRKFDGTCSKILAELQAKAQQRWDAKQAKDWAAADTLRKELEAAGWLIKDSKEGFTVVPK